MTVQEVVPGLPHAGHPAVGEMLEHVVALGQPDAGLGGVHSGQSFPRRSAATLPGLMAKVCHSCGKGPAFGTSRSHSMVATKRRFNPNLQKVRIMDGKAPRRAYVCTRCLKAGKVTKAV